jgi:nitroimidazol reductase NimA-like FMN-containing flavoprotein (pyridoxamine 5'-phosphate oxidase superfamily)
MPGYGILDANSGKGLLPWSWAVERLTNAHNYWVATTQPDGRPHLMAVWGIWLDDCFYFSTGRQSRKARNLSLNPRCTVSTERADQAVIVEGVAREVTGRPALSRVCKLYEKKYGWDMSQGAEPFFALRPRVAFGFIESIEDCDDFIGTATRWVFSGD